jgi:hypothetical protein
LRAAPSEIDRRRIEVAALRTGRTDVLPFDCIPLWSHLSAAHLL